MEKYENILKQLTEKFEKYRTYYEILQIKESSATNEKVKEAYEKKCKELEGFFNNCKGEEIEKVKSLIITALDDAYTALKSEDSRKNYKELLEKIEGAER